MSFRNDYKSAFRSASPDIKGIIARVHERLNENAHLEIRTEQKKKRPLWQIIAPVAGAAACIALCIIFIPRFFGLPLNNAGGMNNAENMDGAGNSPEFHDSMSDSDSTSDSELSLVYGENGDITEVVYCGKRYFRTGTIRADEASGNINLVIHVDGADFANTYFVKYRENEDIIYVAEENSEWTYVFE